MTTAMTVARYFEKNKATYGEMQLQKLLYYTQAWSLAWTGQPLFTDEIEAWKDGPVVRTVWAAHRHTDYVVPEDPNVLSDDQIALIDAVYSFYGASGGRILSGLTHQEQPWIEARGALPADAPSSKPLSQATMRRYYTRLAAEGASIPKQPVRHVVASDAQATASGERQAARWRVALDALAHR